MQIVGQTWLSLVGHEVKVSMTCISWSSDSALYLVIMYICIYIILLDYESVWPKVWPQNKCRSLWPTFHGPMILPCILKTIWCMNIIIWDYESVWLDIWPKIIVGHCDLYFIVQWFCVISWRQFDVWTSYFRIMTRHLTSKVNVSHCDIYCMVQSFCLIFWRLFDVCTSYFGIMNPYDLRFDLKINVGQCDLYIPIFNSRMILPFILKTIRCVNIIIWDYDSVWPYVWPQNKCRSHIFHGQVILLYILKTIRCMNIIIWDYESLWPKVWLQNKYRSLWPIFHGSVILPYILKTIWCKNIIIWDYESVWS